MANNIPLIVSRINGLDELLDDTLCIFINAVLSIEGDISFDIKDLSNTILMLSLNKSLRSELTARSFEVLTERFAFSEGVANFYVLTFKLCGNSSLYQGEIIVYGDQMDRFSSEAEELSWDLKPNPANTYCDLNINPGNNLIITNYLIEIFDSYSRKFKSYQFNGCANSINLQDLTAGTYLVNLILNKKSYQKTLIIQK